MLRRYALRDDQWERIKDFLPGREGHVGGTAADNRLFVDAVLYRYEPECLGVIYQNGLAIGRIRTDAGADGLKAASWRRYSSTWLAMPITNTR